MKICGEGILIMNRTRDWKVKRDQPKVRFSGEKDSTQNKLRSQLYSYAYERLDEANEQGMFFEVIALCDMLITDRLEAYCQYLLHNDDLQFNTMSTGQAIEALEVALKDNAPEVKSSPEWKQLSQKIRAFANARNTALHSFVLIKNAATNVSLDERIVFVEVTAEEGNELTREVDRFVKKNIKL